MQTELSQLEEYKREKELEKGGIKDEGGTAVLKLQSPLQCKISPQNQMVNTDFLPAEGCSVLQKYFIVTDLVFFPPILATSVRI